MAITQEEFIKEMDTMIKEALIRREKQTAKKIIDAVKKIRVDSYRSGGRMPNELKHKYGIINATIDQIIEIIEKKYLVK